MPAEPGGRGTEARPLRFCGACASRCARMRAALLTPRTVAGSRRPTRRVRPHVDCGKAALTVKPRLGALGESAGSARVAHELGPRSHPELREDRSAMRLDGA